MSCLITNLKLGKKGQRDFIKHRIKRIKINKSYKKMLHKKYKISSRIWGKNKNNKEFKYKELIMLNK
jgi:hypothetical protein